MPDLIQTAGWKLQSRREYPGRMAQFHERRALCFGLGYLLAGWLSGRRDTMPLTQICARVGYVNALQQELPEQQAASEEVRNEFALLVEQCRAALRDRAEETD